MSTQTRILTMGALVLLGLGTTACMNPIEGLIGGAAQEAVEQAAEEALGGEDSDVDFDLDGDGVDLPSDFPSDLPLPDAQLVVAAAAEGGFQLSFLATASTDVESVVDELTAMGYEIELESAGSGLDVWSLNGPEWNINIGLLSDEDGEGIVTYSVTPLS